MVTHAAGTEAGTAGVIETGQMTGVIETGQMTGVIETGQLTGTKGTDHLTDLTGQPGNVFKIFPGAARQQPVTSLQHFERVHKCSQQPVQAQLQAS